MVDMVGAKELRKAESSAENVDRVVSLHIKLFRGLTRLSRHSLPDIIVTGLSFCLYYPARAVNIFYNP